MLKMFLVKLLKVLLFWKFYKKFKMVIICFFKRFECWWVYYFSVMSCYFVEEIERIWVLFIFLKGLFCKEGLFWKS